MSRNLRNDFPDALWHITSRGVEKRNIFFDDRDRRQFLTLLGTVVTRYSWCLYAYVLMSNHYHLLLSTPDASLSRGMQRLGGMYAEHFNRRHARWGHLFGSRFKSHLVVDRRYLIAAARYIVLNPVRAGITATAGEWPWSSYRVTAGVSRMPRWLAADKLLDEFHPEDADVAVAYYREFVSAAANEEEGVRPLYRG